MNFLYLCFMSLIEVNAKLTAQNQTTVPIAVRKALNLTELDQIKFVISKSGKVALEKVVDQPHQAHEDPMVLAYLAFLEKDIIAHPQRLSPLERRKEVDDLLADVEVDFDLDFSDVAKQSTKK